MRGEKQACVYRASDFLVFRARYFSSFFSITDFLPVKRDRNDLFLLRIGIKTNVVDVPIHIPIHTRRNKNRTLAYTFPTLSI